MISKSIKSKTLDASNRVYFIANAMHQCRSSTLDLFKGIDDATFCYQAHADFSPVGWHLGHIAYTEALWILERQALMPCLFPQYRRLFAADGLPKTQRVKLPSRQEVYYFLDTIREKVLDYLERANLDQQERLWRWLIQHESQHSETVAFLLQLQRCSNQLQVASQRCAQAPKEEMIMIPGGEFDQGSSSIDALDNERPQHKVYLDTYLIDRYPVTCRQYRAFIEADGYQNSQWWSIPGWEWQKSQMVTQPLYWLGDLAWEHHPVCGVSWYEAEAYARFVGKRLPTEAEWEKAASWQESGTQSRTYPWGEVEPSTQLCNYYDLAPNSYSSGQTTPVNAYPEGQSAYGCYDFLGNVWEWTASAFQGYPGFVSYPYSGYSQVYFDGQHRVLKGGSWATRPWALRCSFRNWYHPSVRQIVAGFRCAADLAPETAS